MRNKKGDLSMNMIIVAALAIIVLLVVVMMFSGKMKIFGGTMQSCSAQGGMCSGTTSYDSCSAEGGYRNCIKACDNEQDYVVLRSTDCEKNGAQSICCKAII